MICYADQALQGSAFVQSAMQRAFKRARVRVIATGWERQ